MTDCIPQLSFGFLGGKEIVGDFNGGDLSSDGGVMLVREADAPSASSWISIPRMMRRMANSSSPSSMASTANTATCL